MSGTTEAFSRVKIDAFLKDAGWNLSDGTSVLFEHVLPDGSRADYALCDRSGRPVAAVEAKRVSVNPIAAQDQGEADAIRAADFSLSAPRREQYAMSQLSDELHEDARRRFEELGRDLLGRVVTFRDPPPRKRSDFSPNVFAGPTLTGADIKGDIHLGWEDCQGKPTGIAVAEAEGLRTGLIGPGYEKLEALALSLARVRRFKSTASVEFLRTQIFEWVKKRHRGQGSAGCVDYLLRALENAAAEHRLLFPVSDLHVQSPLTLGSVTMSTFPERIFEELESKRVDGSSAGAHAEWCRSIRRTFRVSQ